jgi:hypothetical protein
MESLKVKSGAITALKNAVGRFPVYRIDGFIIGKRVKIPHGSAAVRE